MHARPGDWLVTETSDLDRHQQRALIEAVSPSGEPPFRVRWAHDDHVGIVVPGPDARVVTAEELRALDRARDRQFTGSGPDAG